MTITTFIPQVTKLIYRNDFRTILRNFDEETKLKRREKEYCQELHTGRSPGPVYLLSGNTWHSKDINSFQNNLHLYENLIPYPLILF